MISLRTAVRLARLQQVPVNVLPSTAQLFACVPKDQEASTLVAAIIALARTLGLTVLVDGVEQEDQLVFLRDHGCDQAQGPQLAPSRPLEQGIVAVCSPVKWAVDAFFPLW